MSYVIREMPAAAPEGLLAKAREVETATIGHRRQMGFVDREVRAMLPGRRSAGTAATLALQGP
jgi:hypothetical protein